MFYRYEVDPMNTVGCIDHVREMVGTRLKYSFNKIKISLLSAGAHNLMKM